MAELSVIIPARNEEWLNRTVQDVLENREADTEVIVVLDGAWPATPLAQHPDVHVWYEPVSIGQRAATNAGVQLSEAPYVMKLDAHCSLAKGFDRVLIESAKELGPDVVQIPAQKNLHIYDRVCPCGRREYQGSISHPCVVCGKTEWTREIVWKPRRGVHTTAWRLDSDLHFQYWGDAQKQQAGDYCDVMTSLGACVFMAREYFWELGGLDESHGSWGQFGAELALKTWTSGGRHICNRKTWFAHFFRVGGIGFPYEIRGSDQEKAREYSRNLWRANAWPGQVKPLRAVLEQFWPVPGWTNEQRDSLPATLAPSVPSKGIVYYSDNRLDPDIDAAVKQSLERSGLPIVAVTLEPIDWPAARNLVLPLERSYLTMFKQILAGLDTLDTEYIFFAEHDVIYDESHWAFTPPSDACYYYNLNWIKVDATTGRAVAYRAKQTSQLCASRELLIQHYRARIARVERDGFTRAMGFEPGSHGRKERVDNVGSDTWHSERPNYDIRHGHNLTPSRWSVSQFRDKRNCEGWQESTIDIGAILGAQQAVA